MAKAKVSSKANNIKVSFGKRRVGKAKKRANKHSSTKLKYRGQGRG